MIDFEKYPFPGRIRHHTSPNMYLPASRLKFAPDYYPPVRETVDWREVFGDRAAPVALDVGCGKGAFLLQYALENPSRNILGVEIRKAAVDWINRVVEGERIENCAAFWHSVANGLPFIADESVAEFFYLFPDPWTKKKHLKRRAFNQAFLEECYRTLKSGGKLYLASDLKEIIEYEIDELEVFGRFSYKSDFDAPEWNVPTTNKENFCIKENIEYYRVIASKKIPR